MDKITKIPEDQQFEIAAFHGALFENLDDDSSLIDSASQSDMAWRILDVLEELAEEDSK